MDNRVTGQKEPKSLNSFMKLLTNQVIDKYTLIELRLSNLRVLFIMATSIILTDTAVQQIQTMKMSALTVVTAILTVCYVHACRVTSGMSDSLHSCGL